MVPVIQHLLSSQVSQCGAGDRSGEGPLIKSAHDASHTALHQQPGKSVLS